MTLGFPPWTPDSTRDSRHIAVRRSFHTPSQLRSSATCEASSTFPTLGLASADHLVDAAILDLTQAAARCPAAVGYRNVALRSWDPVRCRKMPCWALFAPPAQLQDKDFKRGDGGRGS